MKGLAASIRRCSPFTIRSEDFDELAVMAWNDRTYILLLTVFFGALLYDTEFWWLATLCPWLVLTDIQSQRLPDVLTLPFFLGSATYAIGWADDTVMRLLGASYFVFGLTLIAAISILATQRMMLGGGDIKLIASFPLLAGFMDASWIVLGACIAHAAFWLIATQKQKAKLPFGPSLLVSLVIGLSIQS